MSSAKHYTVTDALAIAVGVAASPLVWLWLVWFVTDLMNPPPVRPEPPAVKVDLAALIDAVKKNPVATREKYRGQVLEVQGRIDRITEGASWKTMELWLVPIELGQPIGGEIPPRFSFYGESILVLKKYDVGTPVSVRFTFEAADDRIRENAVWIGPLAPDTTPRISPR